MGVIPVVTPTDSLVVEVVIPVVGGSITVTTSPTVLGVVEVEVTTPTTSELCCVVVVVEEEVVGCIVYGKGAPSSISVTVCPCTTFGFETPILPLSIPVISELIPESLFSSFSLSSSDNLTF